MARGERQRVKKMSKETEKNENKLHFQVFRNASVMAAGTFLSRILGFVREAVLASLFDRYTTDVFYAAFRLPNLFRRILGEGSLSVGFIPVFVEVLGFDKKHNKQRASLLVSSLFSLLFIVLITLVVLACLFMESILGFVVGGQGYLSEPGKFELTVQVARILFSFVFFITYFAFFMAVLNSLGRFALAAVAPCLLNLSLIFGAIFAVQWIELNVQILAVAALLGGFFQALLLVPQVFRLGYRPRFVLFWKTPELVRVMKTVIPGMLGMSIVQITALINTRFASELDQGSISWMYWADRVLELPLSLFAVSLGTALLPTLSGYWSRGDSEGMAETAHKYLKLIYFLSIPVAVGMFVLAELVVEVLFGRGSFSRHDVIMTTSILHVYAFMLLVSSGVRVLVPSYYAIKNTWFPAFVSVTCLGFHIAMAPFLMERFGLVGLAYSSFLVAGLNLLILILFHPFFIGVFNFLPLIFHVFKVGLATIPMGLFLFVYRYKAAWGATGGFLQAISLIGCIIIAGGVFIYSAKILSIQEVDVFLSILKRKAKVSKL